MTRTLSINYSQWLQRPWKCLPAFCWDQDLKCPSAVLQAMNTRQLGISTQRFSMDEIQSLLRYVWQTENPLTVAVSGTGTAAMEATIIMPLGTMM